MICKQRSDSKSLNQPKPAMTTIYVGNLDTENVDEAGLMKKFGEFGSINSCKLIKKDGNLGYAFINFLEMSHGEKAVNAMNKRDWRGSVINVQLREQRKRHCSHPIIRQPTNSWDYSGEAFEVTLS
jgi:RNA recognition motif-containing protein